jgi:RNA polymerase sigma factor (TIGR02999 family)
MAQAMRRILVDHARARLAGKRGGGSGFHSLEEVMTFPAQHPAELLILNEALERLATLSPREAQIMDLHGIVGLTHDEIANALGVSTRTVKRGWQFGKAWLQREMKQRAVP